MTRLTIMFTILLLNVNVAFSQVMKTANTNSFDYKSKNIESIPDTAFMYPNTKYFYLDGNENLKLDSNFLIFSELEMISVSSCIGIDSLFPWDRFSKLANLDLSFLEYKKIPNSVYRIPNLKDLYIDGNYIKTISDSIFNLKNLEWLNLSENYGLNVDNLETGILESLEVLYLSRCQFTSFEINFINYSNLSEIYLNGNSIVHFKINSNSIKFINLAWNELQALPECITNLSNLQGIDLSNNKISTIENSIKLPKSLNWIDLSGNPIAPEQVESFRKRYKNIKIVF